MKTLTNFEYHGKKAKIGGLCFDESDRMYIFVNYCDNCKGKVVFTREEAASFAKKYQHQQNKIRTRLVIKLVKT